jgi:lysophospholipase L1-like esterase
MDERLVILGDSVTVGAGFSGVDESTRYISILKGLLHDADIDSQLTCSAMDGVDTGYALRRFDRMVARHDPHVVVIALGLNDARPCGGRPPCPPAQFADNLVELIDRSLQLGAHPILSTPPPRVDGPAKSNAQIMEPYADCVRQVAESYHLSLIDVFAAFAGRSDLESLIPDRLHPGPDGHRIIARQFAGTLIPICTRQARVVSEQSMSLTSVLAH